MSDQPADLAPLVIALLVAVTLGGLLTLAGVHVGLGWS